MRSKINMQLMLKSLLEIPGHTNSLHYQKKKKKSPSQLRKYDKSEAFIRCVFFRIPPETQCKRKFPETFLISISCSSWYLFRGKTRGLNVIGNRLA